MTLQEPVKIPDMPGKITFMEKDGTEYVRYLAGRKYNAEKKYTESNWVLIGRRAEAMPGMMYPNDNYGQYFTEEGEGRMSGTMTPEEQEFARNNKTYGTYSTFFDALYHEFRQQSRKRPECPLNRYKAESLNKVLKPLREMMQGEEYAEMLGLAECGEEGGEDGMNAGDVMILLTQYKSALGKFRKSLE